LGCCRSGENREVPAEETTDREGGGKDGLGARKGRKGAIVRKKLQR
jgi:hypothetical protein